MQRRQYLVLALRTHLLSWWENSRDREDVTGTPFVGPAGQLLNAALFQAGIDRTSVYHECGQAFQARAARKKAITQKT